MPDDKRTGSKRMPTSPAIPPAIAEQLARPDVQWEDPTDPNGTTIDKIDHRTKRMSVGTDDIRGRLIVLENVAQTHTSELAAVSGKVSIIETDMQVVKSTVHTVELEVARGNGSLDTLVASAAAADVERLRRDEIERKDKKDTEDRAHEINKIKAGYRVAMLSALLVGIAGIIVALHSWVTSKP